MVRYIEKLAKYQKVKAYIVDHEVYSEKDLEEVLEKCGDLEEMLARHGPNYKHICKPLIRQNVLYRRRYQKTKTYQELATEAYDPTRVNEENVKWLDNWFKMQDINKSDFVRDLLKVMNREHHKKNTFYMLGPSNTGKTMISRIATDFYMKAYIVRTKGDSVFCYQNLRHKTIGIYDEPMITPQDVDTFKLILGGESTEVPVKGQDDVLLDRTPIVLTSNNDNISAYIGHVDVKALRNRGYTYYVRMPIEIECKNTITFHDWWNCIETTT